MAFVQLQSQDHRDLLDIIDQLRSRGISKHVDLPEIIVCGDQSAGKSSVLEAISGMSFPTKDNLCTRFPTELVLRHDQTPAVKVSIIPGAERTKDEKEQLSKFSFEFDPSSNELSSVVETAKIAMGLSAGKDARGFSTDTLRVELCNLHQSHLTIVDLPGLFRAGNSDQSVEDAELVHTMVSKYMKRPRSIILAVVSAKSDFALQDVTELARKLDKNGSRTLGLITKPDTLDAGSDSEAAYFKLAQNTDVSFRLGWHIVKNRSYEMRTASSIERDQSEADFFDKGIWASMNRGQLGSANLKIRLSNVLKDEILHHLPSLMNDVNLGIAESRLCLERLGNARSTFHQQRHYLLQVSQKFTELVRAAVDGNYENAFFGSARTEEGYEKRLRAVVQNSLTDFEVMIWTHGQARVIIEDDDVDNPTWHDRKIVTRSTYFEEVSELMRRSRGRELSGTFNPLVIGELFREQCQPWRRMAINTQDIIMEAVFRATQMILGHIAVEETSDAIFQTISGRVDNLRTDLLEKLEELFVPDFSSHPITYNHYLTSSVKKAQKIRHFQRLKTALQEYLPEANLNEQEQLGHAGHRMVPLDLLNYLGAETNVNMQSAASEQTVDYMQAYYKVSETCHGTVLFA